MDFSGHFEIEELGLLTKFSPAETHYLMKGEYATYKRLFQLTVIDLHLKQVLSVELGNEPDGSYSKGRGVINVSLGKRFKAYEAKEHEQPFIKIFDEEIDIEYLLIHYVKAVKQYIGKENKFIKNMLLQSMDLKPLFGSASWRDFFLSRKLTKRGLAEQGLQKQNIRLLNRHLPALIEKQPTTARKILDAIRGNVFLLDDVDHRLLKLLSMGHFDTEEGVFRKDGTVGNDVGWGDVPFSDVHFDLYIDDDNGIFDTGFDSGFDSSEGGSGCGSSCGSDCGGCGGCGGCGD